jgi:hypothetical protein
VELAEVNPEIQLGTVKVGVSTATTLVFKEHKALAVLSVNP